VIDVVVIVCSSVAREEIVVVAGLSPVAIRAQNQLLIITNNNILRN